MKHYTKIAACIIQGEDEQIITEIQAQLADGSTPLDILNNGIIAGMQRVGELFKTEEFCLPEVLMAAEAMKAGIDILRPLLSDVKVETKGTVVIGTVQGDLHDIGKNLVAMMLETAGYHVINLGCDVSPAAFVTAVREHHPQIVGMSALLTTSMTVMDETIIQLKAEQLRDQIKIIIGGAPTSKEFAASIGADGYSADAAAAVDLVNALITA